MQDESDKDKTTKNDTSRKWSRGIGSVIIRFILPRMLSDKLLAQKDDLSLKVDNEVDPVALDHAQEPSSSSDSLSREEVEAEAEKTMFKKLWGGEYQGSVTKPWGGKYLGYAKKLWGGKQEWSFERIKEFTLGVSKIDFAILYLTPLTYLVLISVVLGYSEIMGVLGLEAWVKYMMYEVQPEGYRNLMRIAGYPFAHYFFQIHTASLLILILSCAINLVTFLCFFVFNIPLANVRILKLDREGIPTPDLGVRKSGKKTAKFNSFIAIAFSMVIFIIVFFIAFVRPSLMVPSGESTRGRLDADTIGILETVSVWVACIFIFNVLIWTIFYVISFRLWPRLKEWMIKDR